MTHDEIISRIDEIRSYQSEKAHFTDNERCHFLDDRLREDFIRDIATMDHPSLSPLAALVLSTNRLGFVRWYS